MSESKQVKSTAKRKPPAAGMGRRPGSKNKATAEIKDMILTALESAGGANYLEAQAHENPAAFMRLLGKILPKDLNASVDLKGKVQIISEFPHD